MRNRVWLSLTALALGIGLLASAGFAQDFGRKGGTLRFGRVRDVDSVDPALAYIPETWMLEFATCAKLYNYPDQPAPEGAIVRPEVAKGLPRLSSDGKTATIDLERGYRFHTGQRITARSFVAALNRVANPKLESPGANYLRDLVGADAAIDGKAQAISGVRALGPYRLQIRTTRRASDLVARLTMPFFCPIAVDTPLREIDDPLGSGPYYVASHVPNRQIVLRRNRFYRGPRPANVDQVVWTIGVDAEACRAAIERDELDTCGISPAAYKEVADTYGVNRKNGRFFVDATLTTSYFAFNHDRPAFRGPGQIPLKQAINWAIDRPALERASGFLSGKRTDQILPSAMTRQESIYPLGGVTESSLAQARRLLAKATFKPEKLVLYAFTNQAGPAWAQIFQFNLKRLGIDVEVRYFSIDTMRERAGTRGEPFDVVMDGNTVDYADPVTFFGPLLDGAAIQASGNGNFAYFDRPRYNREIHRNERLEGEARRRAWADLDVELMRNDPPWAPFQNPAQRTFVSRSFGCYLFHPVFGRDIAAACKK